MTGLSELQQQIDQIERDLERRLPELYDHEALESFRVEFLGRKGRITQLFKQRGQIDAESRSQAGRLIKQLDAADFRTREQATKALTKECGKYRPLLVQALRSGKLSPEARARIEQVLRADALGSQAQKLLTELLKDPDYLINLLSGSPPKTRSAIAEHLRKITGADIAGDPAEWRQWLAKNPQARPKEILPEPPEPQEPRRDQQRQLRLKRARTDRLSTSSSGDNGDRGTR